MVKAKDNINDNPKIITYNNATVDDVIGLENIKEFFRDTLIYYYKNKERCDRLGVSQTRGIIIKGAPGVGKTLVCAACINSYANGLIKFMPIDSSDLTSGQKGEAEKNIRKIFNEIKEDTLVVIDEIDTITSSRRKLSSVLAKEITSALIKALDRNKHIILVGTTNFPEDIDEAIKRRVDYIVDAPYPDNEDRKKMFKKCLKDIPLDNDINIDELAKNTEGFTGNDILSILKNRIGMAYLKKQDKFSNSTINEDDINDILYSLQKDNLPDVKTLEDDICNLLINNNGCGVQPTDIAKKLNKHKSAISRALTSMQLKKRVKFEKDGKNRIYYLIS